MKNLTCGELPVPKSSIQSESQETVSSEHDNVSEKITQLMNRLP